MQLRKISIVIVKSLLKVMPLEENDLIQISELIKKNNEELLSKQLPELITKNNEALQTSFASQISGSNKRVFESIDQIKNVIPKQETIIDAVKASFESGNNNNPQGSNNSSSGENPTSQEDDRFKQLLQKVDNQANAIKTLTSSVEQERTLREKAQHEAAQEKIYGSFISKISDKVIAPRRFLQTLIDDKVIEEKEGNLVIPIKGKIDVNGDQLYEPAIDHVDNFLKSDYSYHHKIREGNGSGSSPGETYQQKPTPKFFTKEINREAGKLDASDLVKAFREGKEEEIFNEAKNL